MMGKVGMKRKSFGCVRMERQRAGHVTKKPQGKSLQANSDSGRRWPTILGSPNGQLRKVQYLPSNSCKDVVDRVSPFRPQGSHLKSRTTGTHGDGIMKQDDSTDLFSTGLWFYWYERRPGKEHQWYWGQLVGSTHRLQFIRDELLRAARVSDIDLALERLSYQMENYLTRVYELRERTAKLLLASAGHHADARLLKEVKSKKTRQTAVEKLTAIDQRLQDTYLELLALIDDDIDLRNQNTHDTFLSLGLSTGGDIFDPPDALLDVQHQPPQICERFKRKLRSQIREAIKREDAKISEVIRLAWKILEQADFVPQRHHRP
jgi:hypothetical protein